MKDDTKFIGKNRKLQEKHYKMFKGRFFYYAPTGTLTYELKNGNAYNICGQTKTIIQPKENSWPEIELLAEENGFEVIDIRAFNNKGGA